jgi:hypothetical protein
MDSTAISKSGNASGAIPVSPAEALDAPVAAARRIAVDLENHLLEVDQPSLRDDAPGIQRDLGLPAEPGAAVRHLDQEEDILRCRMPCAVEILARAEQRDVWLRLRDVGQVDGVLRGQDSTIRRGQGGEPADQPIDAACVRIPDRSHAIDLSFDELHPIRWLQDPGIRHRVVLVAREQPLEGLGHTTS